MTNNNKKVSNKMSSLLSKLNVSSKGKTSIKKPSTILDTKKKRLTEVIEETLLNEFSQYYLSLDKTTEVYKHKSSGEIESKFFAQGYHLVIPIDDVELTFESEAIKLDKAFAIIKPQYFGEGTKTTKAEYIKLNAKKVLATHNLKDLKK